MTTPSATTAPVGDPWPEEDPNVLAAMLCDAEREYRKAAARVLNIVKAIDHKKGAREAAGQNDAAAAGRSFVALAGRGSSPGAARSDVLSQHGADR
ncbi:hypothetical protein [Fodinicola acaciae]|uniref:hypothetical protein n=1 Tax=Fodinicola acaciae TaxID=2681555 RepID=UPI0013D77B15|nr:hypothetical protein [Fodinicola acaciae]